MITWILPCNSLPPGPEEKDIRAKLARIGVGPGKSFNFKDLSLKHKLEIGLGMKEGEKKVEQKVATMGKEINGWQVGSAFGDRDFYHGDWLLRAVAAKAGIYGNDAGRGRVSHDQVAGDWPASRWQQAQIHAHLRRGPVPSGECLLVGNDVRRQDAVVDQESHQPLPHQLADAAEPEEERRRFADDLHPERFAGRGEGIQLVAGAEWSDLSGDAPLLAKDGTAFHPAAR